MSLASCDIKIAHSKETNAATTVDRVPETIDTSWAFHGIHVETIKDIGKHRQKERLYVISLSCPFMISTNANDISFHGQIMF
jgi:hypothetical protein